jgi:hypothetical protein
LSPLRLPCSPSFRPKSYVVRGEYRGAGSFSLAGTRTGHNDKCEEASACICGYVGIRGCFDDEFKTESVRFFEEVRQGQFVIVVSDIILDELELAPEAVHSILANLPRHQVEIRDRFGIGPDTDVEFRIVGGSIVLKKAPKKLELRKWKGRCDDSFKELGYSSVDSFMDDVRGR